MGTGTYSLDSELRAALVVSAEIESRFVATSGDIVELRARAAFVRSYWNQEGPQMAVVERHRLPGLIRDVPMVLYRPRVTTTLSPALVFLHGGGFKLGDENANDRQMREIAECWGGVVISLDYLHSPEHVFPSAVEETASVLRRLHDVAPSLGVDPDWLAIGGTSAGASIVFGAAVSLGGVAWLKAAVAIAGAFDFDPTSPSMQLYGGGDLFPSRQLIEPMLAAYVVDKFHRTDPRVALLRANAGVFPPTLIVAAELDVFRDGSIRMAERLQQAGKLHELKVYAGMAHLFFGLSRNVKAARRCVLDIGQYLRKVIPPRD